MSVAFLKRYFTLKSVTGCYIASSREPEEAHILLPEVFKTRRSEIAHKKLGC